MRRSKRNSPIIGKNSGPNRFWTVKEPDIAEAEYRIGIPFPRTLRLFFHTVGCGFFSQGSDDPQWNPSLINGLLSPSEIADLMCDEANQARPREGFRDGAMPFFDTGERTYLVLFPRSRDPERVYWAGGLVVVTESLMEFYERLQIHAGFYIDALKDVDFDEIEKKIADEETRRRKQERASRRSPQGR